MVNLKENESPLISVITVVYNGVDEIGNTIQSVLNQTYSKIEYIIIDGGSIDGTIEVIEQYSAQISYWESESDKGIYDAMNKGILKATGEWIHFLNCGDYYLSKDVVEDFFEEAIDLSIGIVHGNCRVFDAYGYCDKTPAILSKSYGEAMPVFHPSSFIRNKLHKQYLYDISYKLSADYNFFFHCLELGVLFEYRPKIVALFNVGDGASIRNRRNGLKENFKLKGLENSLIARVIFRWKMIQFDLHTYVKYLLPNCLVEKKREQNRRKAGWVKY